MSSFPGAELIPPYDTSQSRDPRFASGLGLFQRSGGTLPPFDVGDELKDKASWYWNGGLSKIRPGTISKSQRSLSFLGGFEYATCSPVRLFVSLPISRVP